MSFKSLIGLLALYSMLSCNTDSNEKTEISTHSVKHVVTSTDTSVLGIVDSIEVITAIKSKTELIIADSAKSPLLKNATAYARVKGSSLKSINDVCLEAYTQENNGGEKVDFKPNLASFDKIQYSGNDLQKFSTNGIRSINIPFGLCADVVYITDSKKPPMLMINPIILMNSTQPLRGISIFGANNATSITKYYPPGEYKSIEPEFTKPESITIYPWTDFYFSTDDPNVPSWFNEVSIKWTSNGNEGSYSVSGKVNNMEQRYYKTITYKLPDGAKLHIWESTKNGSDQDAGWNQHINTNTNTLTINLWLTTRPPLGPRHWIGVRASLME